MLKVMAVDDEPSALSDIADRIRGDDRLRLVGTALSAVEALEIIALRKPQALFLDVQMAGMSGLELAQAAKDLKVVIVSAYSSHALDAFEVDAIDYLLKPINQSRFQEAVNRLVKAVDLEAALFRARPSRADSATMLVTAGRDRQLIPAQEIIAVLADGDYAQIIPANGRSMLSGLSLKQIEASLLGEPFLRLDRSTLINLSRLKSFRTVDRVKMRLFCDGLDGSMLIGRKAATTLRNHLAAGLKGKTP
jgi:DNA-binding LytR/AlgR family response regulator